ncbi:MAG: hypothetical protein AB8E82_13825 [Aureispira sp.]
MRLLFLFLLFSLSNLSLYAQGMAGTWTGYMDQSSGASTTAGYSIYWEKGIWKEGVSTHQLKITMVYNEELDNYTGEYYICETLQKAHYGRFALVATHKNNQLTYETPSKLFEVKNSLNLGFCFSGATLQQSEDEYYEYLKGIWKGWDDKKRSCASGQTVLRRLKDPNKLPPPPTPETPEMPKTPTVAKTAPKATTLDHYEKRAKVTKDMMMVAKDSITIDVWDSNREDGDIISLVFNGKVLLEKHMLTKEKKGFRVALQKGQNVLTLIAHNLGDIPPNTAALEIERNEGRKKITLSSDMLRSESILIIKE